MCDDLKAEVEALRQKGVLCSEVQEARWGSIARIPLLAVAKWALPAEASPALARAT